VRRARRATRRQCCCSCRAAAQAQCAALTLCALHKLQVQSFASALRVLMRNMLSVLSISFLLVNLLSWTTVRLAPLRRRKRQRHARASCTFRMQR
jgi:hypothetical protein